VARVVEAGTPVHSVDLGDVLFGKLDLSEGHVFAEAMSLGGLHERDGLALHVPGKDDLGG